MASNNMRQLIGQLESGYYGGTTVTISKEGIDAITAEFNAEQERKRRGLMSDAYNLDCSRNVPSYPYGEPPLPTIDYTAARYERKPDNGNRNRRTDNLGGDVQFLQEGRGEPIKVTRTVNGKPVENAGIDATLDERGKRYGSYTEKAAIIQQMKESMRAGSSWAGMAPDMKESLEMVVHKIGRIVTGDVNYHDNWHDLIGYTKLVADRLEGVAR